MYKKSKFDFYNACDKKLRFFVRKIVSNTITNIYVHKFIVLRRLALKNLQTKEFKFLNFWDTTRGERVSE